MKVAADNDRSPSDEIRPQDGRARYWMFLNGEQTRLFVALAGALSFVGWSFLYILSVGQRVLAPCLLAVAAVSFVLWRVVDRKLRELERSNWKKDRRPPNVEKLEARVAVGLWLFIFGGFSIILVMKWYTAR